MKGVRALSAARKREVDSMVQSMAHSLGQIHTLQPAVERGGPSSVDHICIFRYASLVESDQNQDFNTGEDLLGDAEDCLCISDPPGPQSEQPKTLSKKSRCLFQQRVVQDELVQYLARKLYVALNYLADFEAPPLAFILQRLWTGIGHDPEVIWTT